MRSERIVSLIWLSVAVGVTIPAYTWHQEYFRNTGAYYGLIRLLPLLCVAALAYVRWLRRYVKRFELAAILLSALCASAVTHPRAFCVVALTAIAALAIGDLISSPMNFQADDAPVVWVTGFGGLILLVVLFGKLRLLSAPWLIALLLLSLLRAAFAHKRLLGWVRSPLSRWSDSDAAHSSTAGIAAFFVCLLLACSLMVALTPAMAFDVLAYHFPVARLHAEQHSLQPIPEIVQSYYPQGAEALMTLAFSLGDAAAAQLMMPFLGALFLWLTFRVGRCCGLSTSACFTGTAITATIPFLQWTLSVPKDDAALAVFQLAALYSFLQWQRGRGQKWILLASFLLGQTAGVKHVALFGIVALAPLILWAWIKDKMPWRDIALAAFLFAIAGLFWHLQTYLLTGNPIFPEGVASAVSVNHPQNGRTFSGVLWRYVTLPWYLLFKGGKAFESPTANPLGMFLFLFAPALVHLLWKRDRTAAQNACLIFAAVYLVYWGSVLSTLRYAIVPFALIALAGGAALTRLIDGAAGWQQAALQLGAAYSFLFSLIVVMTFEVNSLEPAYLMGRLSREEYLKQALPTTGSLFRLSARDPHASVFGVENGSRFYAPDPVHFAYTVCEDDCAKRETLAALETGHFQYAIIPSTPDFQGLRSLVMLRFGVTAVENDGYFVTLSLDPKNGSAK